MKVKVPDGSVGRRVKCPRCDFSQHVPATGHLPPSSSGASSTALSTATSGDSGTQPPLVHPPAQSGDSGAVVDAAQRPDQVETAEDRPPSVNRPLAPPQHAPLDDMPGDTTDAIDATATPRPMPKAVLPRTGPPLSRDVPLSSQPSVFRPPGRSPSLDDPSAALEAQSGSATGRPHYSALWLLAWLFRVMAFAAVGMTVKRTLIEVDGDTNAYDIATTVIVGVMAVAGLWFLAELARAVRDIARNSFSR